METLGDRLKVARKRKKFTQMDLTAATGVSQQVISFIEVGQTNSTPDIFKLADALQVNPKWLATGEGVMTYDDSSMTDEEKIFLQLLRSLTTKQKNDALAYFKEFEQQNRVLFDELSKLPINQAFDK